MKRGGEFILATDAGSVSLENSMEIRLFGSVLVLYAEKKQLPLSGTPKDRN